MKRLLILLILFQFFNVANFAQKHKTKKKEQRKEQRAEFRKAHRRFDIILGYIYANLDTRVSFSSPNGLLSAGLGLEENLKLPGSELFLTGAFIARLTPRSGIYAHYYGIDRNHKSTTEQD